MCFSRHSYREANSVTLNKTPWPSQVYSVTVVFNDGEKNETLGPNNWGGKKEKKCSFIKDWHFFLTQIHTNTHTHIYRVTNGMKWYVLISKVSMHFRFCWCWQLAGWICPSRQSKGASWPRGQRSVWGDCMSAFSTGTRPEQHFILQTDDSNLNMQEFLDWKLAPAQLHDQHQQGCAISAYY